MNTLQFPLVVYDRGRKKNKFNCSFYPYPCILSLQRWFSLLYKENNKKGNISLNYHVQFFIVEIVLRWFIIHFYTSMISWRGYIFNAVCLCVCMSVCVSVQLCLWTKFQLNRWTDLYVGFQQMSPVISK